MESKLVTSPIAVRCHKLSFAFNSGEPVLSDLSMTVPRASFYCLLGASSCGKTTLLKIIIGTFKAINGEVKIFGRPIGSSGCLVPGHSVGYMPQTLCFPAYFSIETILYYFAQINQVPCSQINGRIKTMIECFDLPDIKRNVADLSGGQKRRLSLAIALIHLPALLILDEPTVGVDPNIKQPPSLVPEFYWLDFSILDGDTD